MDMPNLVSYLNQSHVFKGFVFRCRSNNKHQKDTGLKKDRTRYSKLVNHLRLKSQHNIGKGGGWGYLIVS